MNDFIQYIINVYRKLVNNIAFIPTLMGVAALVLAIVVLYLEHTQNMSVLNDKFSFALVHGADNARMVLATIVGGIISLTVFSFSMVMVVLNRVSASLSPRVLPKLVAQKSHQIVLGFYMGTIIYSLILIVNIDPGKSIPSFGILLSMTLAISSLGLFIYFIRSISQSIQVENILNEIFNKTERQIEEIKRLQKRNNEDEIPVNWLGDIESSRSGHYTVTNMEQLVAYLEKHSMVMKLLVHPGQFVLTGAKVAGINREHDDQELRDLTLKSLHKTYDDYYDDGYYHGLRKISEIAVKALSPGINDPGTALRAIRLLTLLFEEILSMKEYIHLTDKSDNVRILKKLPDLEILFAENITPIRQYAGQSTQILPALFEFYYSLLRQEIEDSYAPIFRQTEALGITVRENITNHQDRQEFNQIIEKIKRLPYCPKGIFIDSY